MDAATGDCGVFDEAVVFLKYFADLPDVRQSGKVRYPLAEVLLLCLLAVLAGAETFVDIALFGETKLGLLRRFRSGCLRERRTETLASSSPNYFQNFLLQHGKPVTSLVDICSKTSSIWAILGALSHLHRLLAKWRHPNREEGSKGETSCCGEPSD
jgi:hypothetical protein